MALMQSGMIADLSRSFIRLGLISRTYASIPGGSANTVLSSSLGSVFTTKLSSVPTPHCSGQQALVLGGVRSAYSKRPNLRETRRKYKDDENAQHFHGFSFYPRFPNHQDPPIEPTKLFAVRRIRGLHGCPRWEKQIIRDMDLVSMRKIAIFKNTPANNALLYKVKHLVEITPVTVPYGLPDKPENGFLKQNGEFVAYNPISQHGTTFDEAEKQFTEYNEKHMDQSTLRSRLHTRWHSRYDII